MAIVTGQQILAADVADLVNAVIKTADETVNNSNALQNDNELLFAVGVNSEWIFQIKIGYISAAAADIKFAITIPAAATLAWTQSTYLDVAGSAAAGAWVTASGTSAVSIGAAADRGITISGSVITAGTAGNVQLQWAQSTADVSDTKVLLGSHIIYHKTG